MGMRVNLSGVCGCFADVGRSDTGRRHTVITATSCARTLWIPINGMNLATTDDERVWRRRGRVFACQLYGNEEEYKKLYVLFAEPTGRVPTSPRVLMGDFEAVDTKLLCGKLEAGSGSSSWLVRVRRRVRLSSSLSLGRCVQFVYQIRTRKVELSLAAVNRSRAGTARPV